MHKQGIQSHNTHTHTHTQRIYVTSINQLVHQIPTTTSTRAQTPHDFFFFTCRDASKFSSFMSFIFFSFLFLSFFLFICRVGVLCFRENIGPDIVYATTSHTMCLTSAICAVSVHIERKWLCGFADAKHTLHIALVKCAPLNCQGR